MFFCNILACLCHLLSFKAERKVSVHPLLRHRHISTQNILYCSSTALTDLYNAAIFCFCNYSRVISAIVTGRFSSVFMKALGNSTAIMMPIVIGYRLLVTGPGFPDKIMYSSFTPHSPMIDLFTQYVGMYQIFSQDFLPSRNLRV